MKTLIEMREAIEYSWGPDTTYNKEDYHLADHHSYGQCAVSALVLQDECGGLLKKGLVEIPYGKEIVHYWNYINGLDVDLTWAQFPLGSKIVKQEAANRLDLLENEWMEKRYKILKERVEQYLWKTTEKRKDS